MRLQCAEVITFDTIGWKMQIFIKDLLFLETNELYLSPCERHLIIYSHYNILSQ